ncbi:MAG: DUF6504 family protein [Actinomycetota bacterium]|nr:DUF6504 family protein [Actinomycetota bacterium]
MAKRYDDPIDVTADPYAAIPVAFSWRGRRYDIDQHLSSWRDGNEWWNGASRRDREYHRVLARPASQLCTGDIDSDGFLDSNGAVYDVYLDRAAGIWRMARVWD